MIIQTRLAQRMLDDLQLAGHSPGTQRRYLRSVRGLAQSSLSETRHRPRPFAVHTDLHKFHAFHQAKARVRGLSDRVTST